MAKQQEPVIRQTPDGPMREIREKFPSAWYAAGGFCLLYAFAFPLYRLHHFLLCAGLACAAAAAAGVTGIRGRDGGGRSGQLRRRAEPSSAARAGG